MDIPVSVRTIYPAAFDGSSKKAEIYYAGTLAEWKSISGAVNYGATRVYGAPHTVTVNGGGSTGPTGTGPYNEGKTVTVYAGAYAGKV